MPVLEVTQLRLKELAADDPALLESLSAVRAKLHTGSRFYNCIEDPSLIYILGIWPSLDAHVEFLASPSRDEVLGPQEDMLQFCWTVHVEMGGMDLLPLDAPILAIERIRVSEECTQTFNEVMERHVQKLQSSYPFKVAHGWRCDAAPNTHESLVFSGWPDAQAHIAFTVKGSRDGQCEMLQITHARNMEREVD
jgi:heme-degrading monooxygenase HmoA